MPEAVKAVVNYQLNENNVVICIAMYNMENVNSGKVMEKVGMQFLKSVFRPYCKDRKTIVENYMYKIEK